MEWTTPASVMLGGFDLHEVVTRAARRVILFVGIAAGVAESTDRPRGRSKARCQLSGFASQDPLRARSCVVARDCGLCSVELGKRVSACKCNPMRGRAFASGRNELGTLLPALCPRTNGVHHSPNAFPSVRIVPWALFTSAALFCFNLSNLGS